MSLSITNTKLLLLDFTDRRVFVIFGYFFTGGGQFITCLPKKVLYFVKYFLTSSLFQPPKWLWLNFNNIAKFMGDLG